MADAPESFGTLSARLDEILTEVKKKDVSLEHSLDLFDEAIALGTSAIGLVESAPQPEELAATDQVREGKAHEGETESSKIESIEGEISETAADQVGSSTQKDEALNDTDASH